MRAKIHKFIEIDGMMTAREVFDAISEVIEKEGGKAWGWTIVFTNSEMDRPSGLQTGMGYSPPVEHNEGLGYRRKKRG